MRVCSKFEWHYQMGELSGGAQGIGVENSLGGAPALPDPLWPALDLFFSVRHLNSK